MIASQLSLAREAVDWKMFGVWLDTEGSISSVITRMRKGDRIGRRRDYEIGIYQDEKEVVKSLQGFLIKSGISSYLYENRRTGVWALKVYRIKDIERIIQECEPYLLTQKKHSQIEKYKRFRNDTYKRIPKVTN